MSSNAGRFKSPVTEAVWQQVRSLLEDGERTVDVATRFAGEGVTATAINSHNSRHWHIALVRSARRGAICPFCGERAPNYRGGKCRSCYNASRRTGRPSGAQHPQWRGGKTKTAQFIRFTPEYKTWRKSVFERDNYTCQHCGVRGGQLHADHIMPQCNYPELRFELSNGRTLCVPCHRATPTWGCNAKQF